MDGHVRPRARVGIIGAGRVGRALALSSRRSGLEVVAAWSRTSAARQRFATELGVAAPNRLADVVGGCDILIVAVPDEQLAAALGAIAPHVERALAPLVVVTSGSRSLAAGAEPAAAGARVVRIHPLHAITDAARAEDLDGVVAAVTASTDADRLAARALAVQLGMAPFDLDDRDAAAWHAAGTLAAGGVATLLAAARDLAVAAGLTPDAALRAMADLARGAIDRAAELGPEAALTGPVVRGDSSTIAAHVEALQARRPDLVEPYRSLARAAAALARRAERIDDADLARIEAAVGDAPHAAAGVPTWA